MNFFLGSRPTSKTTTAAANEYTFATTTSHSKKLRQTDEVDVAPHSYSKNVDLSTHSESLSDDEILPFFPQQKPTAYTTKLVSALMIGGHSDGPLTSIQVDQWKNDFQELIDQGDSAIPAIGEYLVSFENTDFQGADVKALGYPNIHRKRSINESVW